MGSKTGFDKDLDEYLSERSRKQFFFNMVQTFKSKKKEIQLNPEIETYETDSEKDQVNEQKQGFFSRLFSIKEEQDEYVEVSPTRDELKFVAQLALDKIKKLPADEVELFKVSAEFQKLREILKRHELIK